MVKPIRKGGDIEKNDEGKVNVNIADKSVTIKEVYSILLKEAQMPTLQSIPLDIYKTIAASLENLKEQEYDGLNAYIRDRIVNMMSICVNILLDIRHLKLVEQQFAVQNGKTLESGWAILPAADYSKLTDEEKYILDAEREFNIRKKAVLAATLQGRPKVLESISSRILLKQTVVRFIRPMEQFIGVNMTRYGIAVRLDVSFGS
jgi:DNA replication factor GINS